MRTSTKILLGLATTTLLIGGIGAAITYHLGVKQSIHDVEEKYTVSKDTNTLKINSNQIDYSIAATKGDDIIVETNGVIEKINPLTLEKNEKDGTFTLNLKRKITKNRYSVIHLDGIERTTIYVPSNIKNIEASSGNEGFDIHLRNLSLENLTINNSDGSTYLNDTKVESLSIKKRNTNVHAEKISISSLNVGYGIYLDHVKATSITAKTTSNDIDVDTLTSKKAQFTSTDGDINLLKVDGPVTAKNQSGEINYHNNTIIDDIALTTTNGDINVYTKKKPNNLKVVTTTTDSERKLYGKKTDAITLGDGENLLEIHSKTGDIKVAVRKDDDDDDGDDIGEEIDDAIDDAFDDKD